MALSTTIIKNRMGRDSALLLLPAQGDDEKNDIIDDALAEFVSFTDQPILSANLSVTASVEVYSIPATIRKVASIRDADTNTVVYSIDRERGEIVLQSAPGAAYTFVVYGTPADPQTNRDTVIAAIRPDDISCFFAYIRWSAHEWAGDPAADKFYVKARTLGKQVRRRGNRSVDNLYKVFEQFDVKGRRIGDSGNASGFDVDINNQYESDL